MIFFKRGITNFVLSFNVKFLVPLSTELLQAQEILNESNESLIDSGNSITTQNTIAIESGLKRRRNMADLGGIPAVVTPAYNREARMPEAAVPAAYNGTTFLWKCEEKLKQVISSIAALIAPMTTPNSATGVE